jgi:hypothetical protein
MTFRKLDLFPSSVGNREKTPLDGLVEAVSETSCFLVPRIPDDEKSPKTQ